MSLLSLERVSKRYEKSHRVVVALDDVSLAVEPGELVAVWGGIGSGRTTLLRVAAGLERPDDGVVLLDGERMDGHTGDGCPPQIAYVQPRLVGPPRQALRDRLAVPLLARGASQAKAQRRVIEALERTGAPTGVDVLVGELDAAESTRVGIAQALLLDPKLMLIDEPTATVPLIERDGVLAVIRATADRGVGVLMTAGEAIGLSGVDRAVTISAGRVCADVRAQRAVVVPLRSASR